MAKGCSRLDTLLTLVSDLKKTGFMPKIDEIVNSRGHGHTLLSLLKIVPATKVNLPTPLLDTFMKYYKRIPSQDNDFDHKKHAYGFLVCGEHINVTLEDVLFLTHLPISGEPIVPESNKDHNAFDRAFGLTGIKNKLSLADLRSICVAPDRPDIERIRAILLMIVSCVITPNCQGQHSQTSFVRYVEDLDKVDSYAWGAAMLSYLYQGMKTWKREGKSMDGFAWLIIGFFFLHFKTLFDIFQIPNEKLSQNHVPLLKPLIDAVAPIGANHRPNAMESKLKLVKALLDGNEESITWSPYTPEMLPPDLHDQIKYCTVVAPLFCYNYVEHHLPHLVARQFNILNGVDLKNIGSDLKKIAFKKNAGSNSINFKKHYTSEVNQWNDIDNRLAQSYHPVASLDAPALLEEQHDTNEDAVESQPTNPESLSLPNTQLDTIEGEGGGDNIVNETNPQTPPPRRRRRPGFPTPPKKLEEGKRKTRGIPVERYHGERWKMAKKKPKTVKK